MTRNAWDSVTYAEVRDTFDYDPENGTLTHRKYGRVVGFKQKRGCTCVSIRGGIYKIHRVVWLWMTGVKPDRHIDHINGDPHDNRWSNLRLATNKENVRNAKGRSAASGMKGVHKNGPYTRRFRGCIMVDGRRIHLGYYDTPEEAHEAYWTAAQKYFGEFARKE